MRGARAPFPRPTKPPDHGACAHRLSPVAAQGERTSAVLTDFETGRVEQEGAMSRMSGADGTDGYKAPETKVEPKPDAELERTGD